MCSHVPACPDVRANDCCSAHVVADRSEPGLVPSLQRGRSCFDDGHYLTPDGVDHTSDQSGQGWCRLCNGIILFDDGHYLTPDGKDLLISA